MSTERTDNPTPAIDTDVAERLTLALTELTSTLETARNLRYFQMAERPGRFLTYNFLGGVVRGVGFALGSSTGCGEGPAPSDRRFFFSTRTDFERPWLKLWRTWPDSTVRRTLSVILRPPRAVLPSVSFVSLIRVRIQFIRVSECGAALAVALKPRGRRKNL